MKEISSIQKYSFPLIYVDNGSTDKSFYVLKKLQRIGTNSQNCLIKFSRNFGDQSVLLAGMNLATGDLIVTIVSNGQDPQVFFQPCWKLQNQATKPFMHKRNSCSGDSPFKRVPTFMYYRIFNLLSETKMPVDSGVFA